MNELQTLIDAIKGLTDMDEDILTDEVMNDILNNIDQQFSPELIQQSVNQIIKNLEEQELNKEEAANAVKALSDTIKELVYGEVVYTGKKKQLVDTVMNKMFNIFNAAVEKYHSYSIELPMTVDTNAGARKYCASGTFFRK